MDIKTYHNAKVNKTVCSQQKNSQKKGSKIVQKDIIHIEIYYIIKLAFQMWENDGLANKQVGIIGQLLVGGIMPVSLPCLKSE